MSMWVGLIPCKRIVHKRHTIAGQPWLQVRPNPKLYPRHSTLRVPLMVSQTSHNWPNAFKLNGIFTRLETDSSSPLALYSKAEMCYVVAWRNGFLVIVVSLITYELKKISLSIARWWQLSGLIILTEESEVCINFQFNLNITRTQ